jgi:bifunctional DNA-binding transcriptional regulator/antitoxin component of YhaV-PrlF toxin-antitoxin module
MEPKVKAKLVRKGRTTTSRVSTKHQVTLPVEIMRVAGFKVGDQLGFHIDNGKVVIERAQPKIMNLLGIGNGIYDDFDWEKERIEAWGE